MISLISHNAIPIVIALLIGLIVGWWMFRRNRGTAAGAHRGPDRTAAPPLPRGRGEGRGLADEEAAAVADIAGEFLGTDVHSQLPGASGPPDDLTLMKGVGAKLAAKLNENGIIRFDQLAGLTPAQQASLDARMEQFKGRIQRDRLIEQAGYLARGETAEFEAKF